MFNKEVDKLTIKGKVELPNARKKLLTKLFKAFKIKNPNIIKI